MARPLGEYIDDRRTQNEQEFIRSHPHAVLLGRTTDTGVVDEDTHTQGPPDEVRTGLVLRTDLVVVEIHKPAGSLFPDVIAVGRTPSNDIPVPHDHVSKFHAYFSVADDRAVELADAGSKNGTYVDGTRLEPRTPVRLKDGAIITFGTRNFRFHTPTGLYRVLGPLT